MFRDFKLLRRNSGKNEEPENVPVNSNDLSVIRSSVEPSRAPLNSIQDPTLNPKPEPDGNTGSKVDRTPSKPKAIMSDSTYPLRTPDKHGAGFSSRHKFGWAQKHEPNSSMADLREDMGNYSTQVCRVAGIGTGGLVNMTPKTTRTVSRAASGYTESNSTQSTPTKSVSKPPNSGFRSKVDGNVGSRTANFAALYKGMPISGSLSTVVNTVEVPHFDLKEDPSFWMDHNVQVVIRIRPLNSMERSTHGYNRCLKQESSQSITWIGQPETRFTFDHVACETVDQEMLFRMAVLPMVENCLSGYNSCIFAYGQTGSGKTYTMLGEIENLKLKPSPHRGMTPRIFEFLFARIQAEEESRREEKLKYNCKCSFLEIYNEQIADLLDPSSTNLLLREDVKKGVYVENLSEFEVQNVSDILCLITQGSSNRKVAATNMNRESSRSHSVFTCVIESRWEKDSTTNLRFSRLNLVDLAGSERQKTSGAEGERLKEAANINKSLSTLGHAIMVLVDVTNGKPRHVPYRDSRLTFLLQDSLGGNSKTMIIANVSPSISSAAETLNTLKFAQRAKMIQNNAVVNEDSNGDVTALQHQIRLLKDELSILKRQNVSRSLSFGSLTMEDRRLAQENSCAGITCEMDMAQADEMLEKKSKDTIRMSIKQLKYVETTLAGALRREQMAETSIKQLEAEIERLNRLVRQREEDNRCTKMMLRFREDKIQRMESLLSGSFPADTYLLEENRALSEEIQVLQTKLDRNPEVIRFAVENIRLSDQLRRYQEFYEEGEREILLSEVSQLRNQLFQFLDGNFKHPDDPKITKEPQEAMHIKKENDSFSIELENTLSELEECRRNLSSCLDENAKLSSELEDLRSTLNNLKSAPVHQDHVRDPLKGLTLDVHEQNVVQDKEIEHKHKTMMTKHAEEIVNFQLELDILKIILKEERSSSGKMEERVTCLNRDLEQARNEYMLMRKQYEDATNDLKEPKCVIEAIESQQILSINEIDDLRNNNNHCVQLLSQKESEIMSLRKQLALKELRALQPSIGSEKEGLLQQKVNRMQDSIEKAKRMNTWYQSERECQVSNDEERDEICWQAEAETAAVIVCLQEELAIVQQQLQDNHLTEQELNSNVILLQTELKEAKENLYILNKDNESLREKLEEKDGELTNLSEEWARLTSEIEEVLADGCEILIDASDQLDLISGSFPQKRIWISVHVGKLVRTISEKELLIEDLRRCLEDANNKRSDVECMLKSLKGATLAIAEAHQHECSEKEKEILFLTSDLSARESTIGKLENKIRLLEDQIGKTSVCATVAFVIVNRLSEENDSIHAELAHKNNELHKSGEINLRNDGVLHEKAAAMQESEKHILTLKAELEDCKLNCLELRQKLSGEEEQTCAMKEKLEKFEERSILNTREKLVELKTGVSTLRSCTSAYVENSRSPDRNKSQEIREYFNKADAGQIAIDTCEDTNADKTFGEELTTDLGQCSLVMETICVSADDMDDLKPRRPNQDGCDRGATILLLKKEIECALESLKEVKVEMEMLREEKMQMWHSDKKNQESMKCMMIQVLNLQELMSDFENQTKIKMEAFVQRVEKLERIVLDAGSHLYQSKELIEQEVHDVKLAAAQKAAEVVCILSKFEEAQDTIKEADIVINGLLIANEALKLEVKKLQKMSATLSNDRDVLAKEFQSLQSINSLNIQQIEHLSSDLMETKALTMEMEGIIAGIQNNFEENNMILASDFCGMKSLVFDSSKLVHLWLEDIWSGIIVKDCAVSVLHLCHMGILLETDIGLNAENGLLQHGLQNSNDVIADLREHNVKSRKELDMCRITEGKLLTDIKNSFDRVSRKEKENLEFGAKLSTFEKKILDLQLQEEMILQRSNDMASQLAILMKELDSSNSNFFISFLDEEKLLKDKVEFFQSQMELLMENLCLKDFESLILASELEEMTLHNVETKRKHISHCTVLEYLKRDIYLWKVDAALKEQFSANMEVEVHYHISDLDQQNKKLQKDIKELEILLQGYNSELETKEVQLTRMVDLESENETLRTELRKLTPENNLILPDLEVKNSHLESSLNHLNVVEKENQRLQDEILSVENCLMNLRMDLEVKKSQVQNLEESQSAMLDELNLKIKDFQIQSNSLNELKKDNAFLREEILSLKKSKNESLTILCSNTLECVEMMDKRLLNSMSREVFMVVEKRFQEICETIERTSYFMEEIEYLQSHVKEVVFANRSLQTEIKRKDDVLNGLLFDLSLLQESTSNTKDQKDEIEELISSLETLEVELAIKSRELGEATTTIQMLEVELRDKTYMISDLELNISKEQESCSSLSQQDQELRSQLQDALVAKSMVEEELTEKKNVNESLEMEIFEMGNALDEMNDLMESLKSNLNETAYEKDHLQVKVLALEKKLVTKEARIEENEAKAKEAQQIAEMRKLYAEEKEEEVELLERSIQELEYTINVLENEVNIVKKDADRQRLQREELELELHTAMHQMQNLKNAESEMRSCLDEKEKYVQEMQKHMQILERDIADKDAEIAQFKAHISELNMHAEAQACEYKQKFKALEAMAEQVRSESHSSNITNFSSNKLEKCPTKPRGSGSPFKCIGLGMAQQVKSERDEELITARLRIEELETLAASRQKEIFTLKSKLAAAESMTHDVIRDLLGVKLDMTTYVSLLDNQQVQKITEKARLHNMESQEVQGVNNLMKQLNEFIEERQGWLEEIDRKQAEITAAELALEKLRQQEQFLKTENEMLKTENINQKKKVMQLEGEVSKLSGQQNLQQRIHHHAKIKEENNMLNNQNEDLSSRLRRTELILSRVKEELARFRGSIGKTPHIDFDEENRLSTKLKETEEEKSQLAQKLLSLCTNVLKAAGITKPTHHINPSVAEEALEQLNGKVAEMDIELRDLKYKNKIMGEKIRLSELRPQSSPITSKMDESCQTPRRVSQAQFSALDR